MLKELIENNMILVLPNNMKENVIKEVSSLDKIYNINVPYTSEYKIEVEY